ncbi:GNAT family N-acetyltransferase [Longispora albida]|uniref:GNAT family N-acetyltransferase n=1 Tax=Longispora albida TaxID=203523 RepID=UPI0003695155|nr:GNAT family protein [Longispora albida]
MRTGINTPVRRFPPLTVQTPRLLVRALTLADAPAVTAVFDDRQTRRWLPFPDPFTPDDAQQWCTDLAADRRDSGDGDHYAVERREDGKLIGCLWAKRTDWAAQVTQVTYAMSPEVRGMGVACEALDALSVALVLEHGFHRVELRIAPGNLASRRVAEKAGFTYEGLLRNAGYVHGGRVDLEVWSLVAADLKG